VFCWNHTQHTTRYTKNGQQLTFTFKIALIRTPDDIRVSTEICWIECNLIKCNFRILKTICSFVGDNETHIFYEKHVEKMKTQKNAYETHQQKLLMSVVFVLTKF
jgi:hypothetical protein